MSNLTKQDIADKLTRILTCNKAQAREFVEAFFDEISASLVSGHQVRISGFGNFCLRDKQSRPGRNPKTGEAHIIPARRVVTFRPGVKLRARVEAYQHLLTQKDDKDLGDFEYFPGEEEA